MTSGDLLKRSQMVRHGCFRWRIQPVDATHSLDISAGVWTPSVFRGLMVFLSESAGGRSQLVLERRACAAMFPVPAFTPRG